MTEMHFAGLGTLINVAGIIVGGLWRNSGFDTRGHHAARNAYVGREESTRRIQPAARRRTEKPAQAREVYQR